MRLLTVAEVAARLSLGKSTVYLLAQRKVIPSVKIGAAVRIPEEALEEWLLREAGQAATERQG